MNALGYIGMFFKDDFRLLCGFDLYINMSNLVLRGDLPINFMFGGCIVYKNIRVLLRGRFSGKQRSSFTISITFRTLFQLCNKQCAVFKSIPL